MTQTELIERVHQPWRSVDETVTLIGKAAHALGVTPVPMRDPGYARPSPYRFKWDRKDAYAIIRHMQWVI